MSPGTFMSSVPQSYHNNFYCVPQYMYNYEMMPPQYYDRLTYRQPWTTYPTTTDYMRYNSPNVGTTQSRTHSQSRKRPFTIAALLDIDNDSQNKKNKYLREGSCVKDNTEEFVSSTNCQPIQVSSPTSSDKVSEWSLEAEKKRSFQPFRVPSPHSSEPPSDFSESTTDTPQTQRRKKRIRTIFNSEQLDRLESEFERTQYLVGDERLQLASELNLNEAQVKIWFQNRRIKQRKQFDELQKTAMAKLKSVKSIREESEDMHTELSNTIKELSSLSASTDEFSRTA